MGGLVVAVLVGLPWGYAEYRDAHYRNLRVVTPGVLYRSGQLSPQGLRRVIHDYGIRTVVSLRDAHVPGDPPPDLAEEQFCKAMAIKHVRITPRRWESDDGGPAPAEEGVRTFLAVMDDPANHPVLVHCFRGVHRTGAHVAIYRMEYDRWTNAEALDEVRACGYDHLDDEWDVLGFLESYRPRWWRAAVAE
jgi:protein tyrosine/serine phosphatase